MFSKELKLPVLGGLWKDGPKQPAVFQPDKFLVVPRQHGSRISEEVRDPSGIPVQGEEVTGCGVAQEVLNPPF